jgi:hypothetical protein
MLSLATSTIGEAFVFSVLLRFPALTALLHVLVLAALRHVLGVAT